MRNHQGFTLIEMLLVLMVLSFFTICPVVILSKWQKGTQVTHCLNQFERYYHRTQQSAVLTKRQTKIEFSDLKQEIIFTYYQNQQTHTKKLTLPADLRLLNNQMVMFLESGSLTKICQLNFQDRTQTPVRLITYQVQIGSGKLVRVDGKS
ncbi:hypothetical protein CBF34_10815 [Vagococcus penaei]|uniref:Uncharacterized protein n=1 Tax=Vagococcus penaei TaxID=633807 RepID=A0A1Q2D5Z8_9ENTE|nr:competence type IV pilus minor pilin ComGD [Vagococcus penaei]AQP53687.1 hypothetical protein BW732_05170 [Vagococcus penaei]RST97701.1 hypothetical protein CBF34_10815 [Vagococcus penaei]